MSRSWATVQLGEVLTERREVPAEEAIASGEIPIVSKIAFNDGKIQLRNDKQTRTGMILIRPGDIVVSGINAEKGAIAVYGSNEIKPIAATIHYGAYIPNKERIDVSYLWWLLRSRTFRELLLRYVPGGIKTELKAKRLLPIPIPLPLLAEQQRIVARIEELSVKIAEAQSLRRDAIAEADRMVKTSIRQLLLANDYQEVHLEDTCEAIIDNLHRNPIYSDSGVPCVRSPDVCWGNINLETALRTSEEEYVKRTVRGEPQVDDIVLVREGGGTGKAGIVEPGQRFSLGQRVMMLRPNKSLVLPRFFLYQLISPLIYEDQILPRCIGSAAPHLNIGALRKFKFLLPSLPEQHWIVKQIDNLKMRVSSLRQFQSQTASEIDAMLPALLDRAFKGGL